MARIVINILEIFPKVDDHEQFLDWLKEHVDDWLRDVNEESGNGYMLTFQCLLRADYGFLVAFDIAGLNEDDPEFGDIAGWLYRHIADTSGLPPGISARRSFTSGR